MDHLHSYNQIQQIIHPASHSNLKAQLYIINIYMNDPIILCIEPISTLFYFLIVPPEVFTFYFKFHLYNLILKHENVKRSTKNHNYNLCVSVGLFFIIYFYILNKSVKVCVYPANIYF